MNLKEVIKKEDALLTYYCAGQIANLFARLATKIKFLTPNFFTTLSFILGISTAILFAYNFNYIACFTLLFTLVFDCADGQTARLLGKKSQFGHWYDYYSDKIKDISLALGLAINAYHVMPTAGVFIFAFLAVAFQFLRNITRLNRQVFELEHNINKSEPTLIKKDTNQFMRCLKHSTLFKEADRYTLFIIFALLKQIPLMLIIYAGLEFCYAMSSAYLNYKKFKKFDAEKHE
jgi:phosphatidylglycerophosphate synthase